MSLMAYVNEIGWNTHRGDIPSTEKDQNTERRNLKSGIKETELNETGWNAVQARKAFLPARLPHSEGFTGQWSFLRENVADTIWYVHWKSLPLDLRSFRKNFLFPAILALHKQSWRSEDFSYLELESTIYLILRQTPRTMAYHCFSLLIYFSLEALPWILHVDLCI